MRIRATIVASAIALLTLGTGIANANVYNFDFLSADTSYHAVGTFTTSNTAIVNNPIGYQIESITGSVFGTGGGTITGLVEPASYLGYPNHSTSPMGAFWIDNLYFPAAPHITLWGVAFTTNGGGNEWNLWANNWDPTQNGGLPTSPVSYSLYKYTPTAGYAVTEVSGSVPVAISAVPEPAMWAMFLLGFGVVGWSLRNSRRSASIATA